MIQKDNSPGNTGKLKNGKEERYTIVIESDTLNDLRNIAYWQRKKIKDAISAAIAPYIESWKADPDNKQYVNEGKSNSGPKVSNNF